MLDKIELYSATTTRTSVALGYEFTEMLVQALEELATVPSRDISVRTRHANGPAASVKQRRTMPDRTLEQCVVNLVGQLRMVSLGHGPCLLKHRPPDLKDLEMALALPRRH